MDDKTIVSHQSGFKIGQRYATPSPGSGDRVFYETLLQQRPESEMAQDYCLLYGILQEKEAKKLHEIVMKRKDKKTSLVSPQSKKSSDSVPTAKRSRKVTNINSINDNDYEGDEWEMLGKSSI